MISTIDIRIIKPNHDLNEREMKILEVLLLNLFAQANAQVNGCPVALNPMIKLDEDILNYQLAYQSPITPEKFLELKENIDRRVNYSLKICNITNCEISYLENSYMNNGGFEAI